MRTCPTSGNDALPWPAAGVRGTPIPGASMVSRDGLPGVPGDGFLSRGWLASDPSPITLQLNVPTHSMSADTQNPAGWFRAESPAAIVGYSGIFVLPDGATPEAVASQITARPPILLLHGQQDDLIPVEALSQATKALAALGVPVEWHIAADLGHGIDEEGLRQGGEFLAHRL